MKKVMTLTTLLTLMISQQTLSTDHQSRGDICSDELMVTNGEDAGPGSLRDALDKICDGGFITFDSPYLIRLKSTLRIDDIFVVIQGSGQVFESDIETSLFDIGPDAFVRLNKVTIQNTNTTTGAITNSGSFTMREGYFYNNINTSGTGGGAITNLAGGSSVGNISFFQNDAQQGGAIHVAGGTFTAISSTFYQNGQQLAQQGAAIYSENHLSLHSVTMLNNGAEPMLEGSSLYLKGNQASMQISNSIIHHDTMSLSACYLSEGAIVTDFPNSAHYFIVDGSCQATYIGDPKLGQWGQYHGYAPTIPLLSSSELIDSGTDLYCGFGDFQSDQHNNFRIYGPTCDLGAVEVVDLVSENGFEPIVKN